MAVWFCLLWNIFDSLVDSDQSSACPESRWHFLLEASNQYSIASQLGLMFSKKVFSHAQFFFGGEGEMEKYKGFLWGFSLKRRMNGLNVTTYSTRRTKKLTRNRNNRIDRRIDNKNNLFALKLLEYLWLFSKQINLLNKTCHLN